MDKINIIIPAASALIASLLTVLLNSRKLKHEVEDRFRDDIIKELNSLRESVKHWSDKYHALSLEYSELKGHVRAMEKELTMKIALFESAHADLPFPMWLKDVDGKMLSLNESYEVEFLRPHGLRKSDYIGKTDYEIWPRKVADNFKEHDQYVISTGNTWEGVEIVAKHGEGDMVEEWQIVKYLRQSSGVKIGIGGIAIKKLAEKPMDEAILDLNRGIRKSDKSSVHEIEEYCKSRS